MEWDAILTRFADQNQGGGALSGGIRDGIIGGSVDGIAVALMGLRQRAEKKPPADDEDDDLPRARRVRRP